MIIFDKDLNLGGAVANWTTFSEIGNKPITDRTLLTIAGGRHKFSRLCGFMFTTKDGNLFAMSFICKLRSKINRLQKKQIGGQWTIPSRWFFLTRTSRNLIDILSKTTTVENFGFDVDKFFKSDLFAAEVPKLQRMVKHGLLQARKFAESLPDENEKRLAVEEVSAIELSIPLMKEDRFEDRDYPLINYAIKESNDMKNKDKTIDVVKLNKNDPIEKALLEIAKAEFEGNIETVKVKIMYKDNKIGYVFVDKKATESVNNELLKAKLTKGETPSTANTIAQDAVASTVISEKDTNDEFAEVEKLVKNEYGNNVKLEIMDHRTLAKLLIYTEFFDNNTKDVLKAYKWDTDKSPYIIFKRKNNKYVGIWETPTGHTSFDITDECNTFKDALTLIKEKSLSEKELDNKIEEALKEIYK